MVHLPPLPGKPFHKEGSFGQIVDVAVASARALAEGGADGCLVQTVDRVYHPGGDSDPARTAAMVLVVNAIAQAVNEGFQVGVQLTRNTLESSLARAGRCRTMRPAWPVHVVHVIDDGDDAGAGVPA